MNSFGVPELNLSDLFQCSEIRKQHGEGFRNLSTAGTFLAGVTATTLQYSNFSSHGTLAGFTYVFWVSSLILSLGCAIQSQVAAHWLQHPRLRSSSITSRPRTQIIKYTPIILFVWAILALSAGICTWTFAAFPGTAVAPIALLLTVVSLSALVVITRWAVDTNSLLGVLMLTGKLPRSDPPPRPVHKLRERPVSMPQNIPRPEVPTTLDEFTPPDITFTAGNLPEAAGAPPVMDFVVEFLEFCGDGILLAYCGLCTDIYIAQMSSSAASRESPPQQRQFARLPTTAVRMGGLSWGPVPEGSDPVYHLVSWDEDSVTLWNINTDRSHNELFDFPVEEVVRAAISRTHARKVVVWTTSSLLILVTTIGDTFVQG